MSGPHTLYQDRWFWETTGKMLRPAFEAIDASPKRGDPVDRILTSIFNRITESANVIRTIRGNHHEKALIDAVAMLRTMYDACLQGMYLVHDLAQSARLAGDFFDFANLERGNHIDKLKKHAARPFAARLLNCEARAKSEPALSKAIAKARKKFRTGSGKGGKETYHQNWYRDNLRGLSAKLGLELEYDLIITVLHGPVHTTPLVILGGNPAASESFVDMCGWLLAVRMVAASMKYHGIEPPSEGVRDIVGDAWENLFTLWESSQLPRNP